MTKALHVFVDLEETLTRSSNGANAANDPIRAICSAFAQCDQAIRVFDKCITVLMDNFIAKLNNEMWSK